MYLVRIQNNEEVTFPIPEQNVRDCEPMFHGQMITPELAAQYGYGIYEQGVQPNAEKYKRIEPGEITQRYDQIWVQQWVTRDATSEEISEEDANQACVIRDERDWLLITIIDRLNPIRWETFTSEQQTAMTNYRQQLLDVPAQEGFPWNVNWPTKPEVQR